MLLLLIVAISAISSASLQPNGTAKQTKRTRCLVDHLAEVESSRLGFRTVIRPSSDLLLHPPHKHPSPVPINTSLYSDPFLIRQKEKDPSWFKHLDFIRMPLARIKTIFWTRAMEAKHKTFGGPPKALQRNISTINEFFWLGSEQNRV